MAGSKLSRLRPEDVKDPVDFIRTFLRHPDGTPITLHQAQLAIVEAFTATSSFIDLVIEAGRQVGKSTGLAWFVCWYLVRFSNRQVYIVAPSLDQSRIIYDEIVRQFTTTTLSVFIKGKPVDFPFPHMALLNGSHVHGRGANSPKYLRGKPVDLLIEDEAAFFKDGIHSETIEPMFTVSSNKEYTGIIRASTPFGEGDFSKGVVSAKKDKTGGSKYLHFSSFDNPYANVERLLAIRDRYGEDSLLWRTEYLAESVGNELAVFAPEDIKWAYEHYPYVTEQGTIQYPVPAQRGHKYAQGVDLANRRDYFVDAVLDITDPLAVQVNHSRLQQKGYAYYKQVVRSNFSRYNNAGTLIDATSLGESVVEDLIDIRAEGYRFTGSTAKYDLVHNLVRALNEHRIAIPMIPELVRELQNFQYEITPSKNLKMEAKEGHDDYVMALALAAELATRPSRAFFLGGFKGYPQGALAKELQRPTPKHLLAPPTKKQTISGDPFAELFKWYK